MIRRYLLSLVALLWLADGPAWGQVIGVGTYAQQSALITTVATNNWVVPANVTVVYVDACASGGGGGGGGTTTSNAGGGGGGAGQCVSGYALNVTPGTTLAITIPAAGAAGAINGNGGAGGNVTITGANFAFPTLTGGAGGTGTTGVTGGTGAWGAPLAVPDLAAVEAVVAAPRAQVVPPSHMDYSRRVLSVWVPVTRRVGAARSQP